MPIYRPQIIYAMTRTSSATPTSELVFSEDLLVSSPDYGIKSPCLFFSIALLTQRMDTLNSILTTCSLFPRRTCRYVQVMQSQLEAYTSRHSSGATTPRGRRHPPSKVTTETYSSGPGAHPATRQARRPRFHAASSSTRPL